MRGYCTWNLADLDASYCAASYELPEDPNGGYPPKGWVTDPVTGGKLCPEHGDAMTGSRTVELTEALTRNTERFTTCYRAATTLDYLAVMRAGVVLAHDVRLVYGYTADDGGTWETWTDGLTGATPHLYALDEVNMMSDFPIDPSGVHETAPPSEADPQIQAETRGHDESTDDEE